MLTTIYTKHIPLIIKYQTCSPQYIPNTSQSSLNTRHAHHNTKHIPIIIKYQMLTTIYTKHTPIVIHYIPDMLTTPYTKAPQSSNTIYQTCTKYFTLLIYYLLDTLQYICSVSKSKTQCPVT